MRIATETLNAIATRMYDDQGAEFRTLLRKYMPLAEDAYRSNDGRRGHLGASLIGRDCGRAAWYGFHWVKHPVFSGQILRLFNRGHLEEPRMLALMEMIGCDVWHQTEDGKQFRIREGYRGHFGGSLDAVLRGVPDIPDVPMLGEFKTHNEKSFAKLKEEGVLKAKWEHFIQQQMYMADYELQYSLYLAVNKNNDELHAEIVQFDPTQHARLQARVIMLVDATEAPPRINNSPGWYKCKMCDYKGVCHGKDLPERNCRTCVHVRVGDGGTWLCENPVVLQRACEAGWEDPVELDLAAQEAGQLCTEYAVNPSIKA